MKSALIANVILGGILAGSSCVAFAQESGNAVFYQSVGPVTTVGAGVFAKTAGAPVQNAPYSATMTNENVQTLTDGTRITQTSTGTVVRDSEGRTRQDAPLPPLGNLFAADAPHLVFLQDPVSQTSYTLNLTDKTAQKMPAPPANATAAGPIVGGDKALIQMGDQLSVGAPPPGLPPRGIMIQRSFSTNDAGKAATEDLGTQTMEGVPVTGVRTTRTIPAGEIGNDRPIRIVTEVWTSPELKTIVYSKRSDPRMGEQTFRLTNINRSEPDASLFTVPPDFTTVEGPQDVIYRSNQ